jgi:hypothetical protein
VAAAIASHGVTEAAGVGEIVSEAAKFLVDPAAALIANVSVPKNEFQSRIRVNEVNLKWVAANSTLNRASHWRAKKWYYSGFDLIATAGKKITDVQIYDHHILHQRMKDRLQPSAVALVPRSMRTGTFRLRGSLRPTTAEVLGDAVSELENATAEQKNNKAFVQNCIRRDGQAFQYASQVLRKDAQLVTLALQTENALYERIHKTLKEVGRCSKYPETPFTSANESLKTEPQQFLEWIKLDARVFARVGPLRPKEFSTGSSRSQ